ncbi:heavy-metal-associated domain-containing protein [Spiroplasma turonicum]|uniref:HMA domain-containing protein n=1 Tax=Spiroplasma turonicum TaxID=216946 RepID=A0A0K1P6I4_9MOLU|nr:heavy metal-associated domain-containing protein [Spiroplasma turonicum]AKU79913.1 hypothetical protein STURON_00667 [Spiroplasma turonicum]ALX70925.1 hypothetical protein STURO_v1c06660 [Spiroplasma turonicum]
MKEIKLLINNLDCPNCALSVEKSLKKINIINVKVLIPLKEVHFEYNEANISLETIIKHLKKQGFDCEMIEE